MNFLRLSVLTYFFSTAVSCIAQQLHGNITDPSWASVQGATVALRQGSLLVASVQSAADGSFSLQPVQEGSFMLSVDARGFKPVLRPVVIKSSDENLNIRLSIAGARAEVTVTPNNPGIAPDTTGSKLALAVVDTPVSLETVSRQTIESRAVVDLDQVVDTVSGIQRAPGFPFQTGYFIRGFFDSYDTLHDGFRDYSASADVSNVDHVEVLKGSPAVDYGTVSTGGILNVITKTPAAAARFGSIDFTSGSYDFYRTTIDLNAPLHTDKLLGRLNLAYRDAGSFRNFQRDENYFVAPAILWKPTTKDTLLLKDEVNRQDFIFPSDFPYYPIFTTIPISESISEPHIGGSQNLILREELDYRHAFNDKWEGREAFGATNQSIDIGQERVYSASFEADGHTLDRKVSSGPQNSLNYTLRQEAYGRTQGLGLTHLLAFGVEGYKEEYNYVNNFAPLAPIDILNPVYGAKPGTPTPGYNGTYGNTDIGLYAQDFIGFGSRWHLLAAGRFDGNDTYSIDHIGLTRSDVHSHKFSPRLALSYQPAAQTTLYFDWSQSFLPNFGTNAQSQAFKPVLGEQYELGAKRGFLNQRLLGTLALYQITKQNVLTTDLNNPQFSIATGQQRSRGIEATAQGEITSGLMTTLAYAYTSAEVTRDNFIPVGSFLANVPRNQISLWTTYRLPFSQAKGIGVAFGDFYAGRRQASIPPSFILNSYNRLDASVFYEHERWRASVNFKNLTDTRNYDVDGGYAIRPNAPLTVLGSIQKQF